MTLPVLEHPPLLILQAGVSYCNSLGLAGKTWRLPNVNELFSILDVSVAQPPINTTFFRALCRCKLLDFTTVQGTPASGWLVSFNSGIIIDSGRRCEFNSLCVRTLNISCASSKYLVLSLK